MEHPGCHFGFCGHEYKNITVHSCLIPTWNRQTDLINLKLKFCLMIITKKEVGKGGKGICKSAFQCCHSDPWNYTR